MYDNEETYKKCWRVALSLMLLHQSQKIRMMPMQKV